MSLVVLGIVAVLFVGYLLAPSIRERVAASPVQTVGTFQRGMNALATPEAPRSVMSMVSTQSSRQVLIPSQPAAFPQTAVAQVGQGPRQQAAAQRRQTVMVALSAATILFFLLGLFSHQIWWVAFPLLVITLAYMSLAHEASRKEEERMRTEKLDRIRKQHTPVRAARGEIQPHVAPHLGRARSRNAGPAGGHARRGERTEVTRDFRDNGRLRRQHPDGSVSDIASRRTAG